MAGHKSEIWDMAFIQGYFSFCSSYQTLVKIHISIYPSARMDCNVTDYLLDKV